MDKKLIKHIAKLSSFELTENQLEQYSNDFISICEILDTVKDYDAGNVAPMVSPITTAFKFREDVAKKQDNRADFTKFACEVTDDYFMVPQVVK